MTLFTPIFTPNPFTFRTVSTCFSVLPYCYIVVENLRSICILQLAIRLRIWSLSQLLTAALVGGVDVVEVAVGREDDVKSLDNGLDIVEGREDDVM